MPVGIANEITDAIRNAKDKLPGAVLIVKHIKRTNGEYCSLNKGPAMKIYRKEDGWYFHCFRCGYQGFIADGNDTPEQLKERLKKLHCKKSLDSLECIELPNDFVLMKSGAQLNVPAEAWHWFLKYGISHDMVSKFGIGWANSYQRVVIPCNATAILKPSEDLAHRLLGWIGREVYCKDKEERKEINIPKYLTKKSKHVDHLFFHAVGANIDKSEIVLVEDVLSAIKIAELTGISAIALLTTYIPESLMLKLRHHKVKIWLDGDTLAKSVGYVTKFQQMGFNVGHIHTQLDPKEYCYQELMDHLNPITTGGNYGGND